MASILHQPITRSIIMTLAFLITVGAVTSCGGDLGSPGDANAATTTPTSTNRGDRLGCGTYCQSAGGYGGAGDGLAAVTIVSNRTITPDADGYLPVTAKCNVPVPCVGAIMVKLAPFRADGRSDLLIDGGETRTIGVPLPPAILAYLEDHGTTTLAVTADARVPDCKEIPQLAAGCAEFKRSPGYTPEDGDGIIRIIDATLTVAPPQ